MNVCMYLGVHGLGKIGVERKRGVESVERWGEKSWNVFLLPVSLCCQSF